MAYVEFYVQATNGNDLNAGSTTAASTYTAVNGNWNNTTKVYTPTDGSTPASFINVGDYCSVYLDAAAVAVYIAKVSTVAAGVNGAITMDATIFYGSGPTTSATGRSIKCGGPWLSPSGFKTSYGATAVPQDTRINIIAATYTRTASDAFNMRSGTTANKLWIRGYNATPGDLDNDTTNSLSKPIFSYNSTFTVSFEARSQLWSSISFSGTRIGVFASVTGSAGGVQFFRCRFENLSTNAAATAISVSAVVASFYYCYFKHPTTGTAGGVFQSSIGVICVGCVAEGGGLAGYQLSGNSGGQVLDSCIALNNTGAGITVAGTGITFLATHCTVSGATVDGIDITAATNAAVAIIGCLIQNCGGWGINNSSTTVTSVFRACNDFYNNALGNETGLGLSPSLCEQTESVNPTISSANMALLAGKNALNHGFPGVFENETFSSYADCGAAQASGLVHAGTPYSVPFIG